MSTGVSVHVQGCKCRRAAGEMQEQRDPDDRGWGRLGDREWAWGREGAGGEGRWPGRLVLPKCARVSNENVHTSRRFSRPRC